MILAQQWTILVAFAAPLSAYLQAPSHLRFSRSVAAYAQQRGNRFEGKVALVTGGSRGIGAAIVRAFEDEGASVVVGDVIDDTGKALCPTTRSDERANLPTALGPTAHLVRLDVRSKEDWSIAIEYCVKTMGGLDILVNNAGIVELGGVAEGDVDSFARVAAINEVGVFIGMAAALKVDSATLLPSVSFLQHR
jgi:3alpha(or 20beta)-hydroxysteroid dehydrogenase